MANASNAREIKKRLEAVQASLQGQVNEHGRAVQAAKNIGAGLELSERILSQTVTELVIVTAVILAMDGNFTILNAYIAGVLDVTQELDQEELDD